MATECSRARPECGPCGMGREGCSRLRAPLTFSHARCLLREGGDLQSSSFATSAGSDAAAAAFGCGVARRRRFSAGSQVVAPFQRARCWLVSPVQHLDSTSPRWQKLEAESRLMNFVTWLVVCRPSGRPISTRSARKYVSQVVTWMRRVYSADFAGGLDLQNLRDLLKGMRRELGDTPVRRRYGVRTQHLRQAMDLCLPRKCRRRAVRSMRALLAVAFCGLLRGGEAALPDGEEFDPRKHLTRGDIRFFTLPDGRRAAVLVIYQAKNSKQLTYKTVPVYLVGGGTLIDPIAELERMLELDPVAEDMRSVTPLFRDDAGAAFRRRDVSRAVKSLMESIGLDPGCFGAHSLRIGGATAALAAGVHPSVIRITGRWSSDVWQIYARLSKQSALGVSMVIGSTPFDDCERGEFMSEELELMPEEMASLGDAHFPVDGVESDSD